MIAKDFSIKFIDILIGMVLGLGFQWWPSLQEPWQYLVFIFVYLDIVDYWIDYAPSLKKFPPKREIDIILDVGIMFSLFLYIYSASQLSIEYLLGAFILFRILDFLWLFSSKQEYKPTGGDALFVNTWLKLNLIEAIITGLIVVVTLMGSIPPLVVIIGFIIFRIVTRIFASWKYKKVHFK